MEPLSLVVGAVAGIVVTLLADAVGLLNVLWSIVRRKTKQGD